MPSRHRELTILLIVVTLLYVILVPSPPGYPYSDPLAAPPHGYDWHWGGR